MIYIGIYFIILIIDLTLIKLCRSFKLKLMDEDIASVAFVSSFIPLINGMPIFLVVLSCFCYFIKADCIKKFF